VVQRGEKLPGAARNIALCFKDFDRFFDGYLQAGLQVRPSSHSDKAALDEVSRFGTRFHHSTLHQKEIESHFHK
jgi:hypothetical protein